MDEKTKKIVTGRAEKAHEKRVSPRFILEKEPVFRTLFERDKGENFFGIMIDFSYEGFSCKFDPDPQLKKGDVLKATIYYYKLPLYSGEVRAVYVRENTIGFELIMSYHYLSSAHFDVFVKKLFEEELG